MQAERYFNTEGVCSPRLHYMVRLDDRMKEIKRLFVDRGKYFVINRGRQYGKTTTLHALAKYLREEYLVLSMDFQEIGTAEYRDENTFSRAFAELFGKAYRNADPQSGEELVRPIDAFAGEPGEAVLRGLFERISRFCAESFKPVVLMIDEVDSAANNQVFLDFLALLRRYYLDRENQKIFHSVILAGVYDIKNLKLKIRPESEHQFNSPWNIAARFGINMNFSVDQIASMLQEYENDNHTGMDMRKISSSIYEYTRGYPYLVSAICKIMDEELSWRNVLLENVSVWTVRGVEEAVKIILKENIPLFDSMAKHLDQYRDLKELIEEILYQGKQVAFSPMQKSVNLGMMFGFLREANGLVAVANRIFEMALLNMFIAEEAVSSSAYRYGQRDRNQFIQGGRLNMELVLQKFVLHFSDIYGDNDERFVEAYGRKLFLLYLKPVINGVGNYYMEAQTRDARRTDVIVDYLGEQFVVEMKIWYGPEYHERGEEQLADYLDYFHLKKGYMLSFNFNKKKETGVKTIRLGERVIVEAVV